MTSITITSVKFSGDAVPVYPVKGVVVKHKQAGGVYVTDDTVDINTDGTIKDGPVVIAGLLYNTSYTVWLMPSCGCGIRKVYLTEAPPCVDIAGMTLTT